MCKINLEESNLEIRSFSFYDGVLQKLHTRNEQVSSSRELYNRGSKIPALCSGCVHIISII